MVALEQRQREDRNKNKPCEEDKKAYMPNSPENVIQTEMRDDMKLEREVASFRTGRGTEAAKDARRKPVVVGV